MSAGLRRFLVVWSGQTISVVGTQLSSFALGVWIFQRTGSALLFGLSIALQIVPGVLLSPLAGVIVDRFNRRTVMLVSDLCDMVVALVLFTLLLNDQLQVWHIYIAVLLSCALTTFQQLAYAACVVQFVPREKLGMANGLVQLSIHGSAVMVPLGAALLMQWIGLKNIMLIDFASFGIALVTLLLVRFPSIPASTGVGARPGLAGIRNQIVDAWGYLRAQPGLLSLLYFFAISSFSIGFVQVLFRPLVLTLSDATTLGLLMTAGGIGGLTGAIVMATWGGPQRHIDGVTRFMFLAGCAIILCGATGSVWLIGAAAVLFSFCVPIITSCSQVIWQRSIPEDMQGRVFAFRQVISTLFMPLGMVLSPFLAEYVFEPLMRTDSGLSRTLAPLLGAGPSRGMALLFIVMGLVVVVVAQVAMRNRGVQQLSHLTKSNIRQPSAPAQPQVVANEGG
ncbi:MULTISPECIES: MFS transporter [Stenotrophomonas]|jgi:MFS family permease|uniref:MFS transporter n=1 Tax=Stenotrophomonas maltophilia TaxID=40324 RepID=A0A4S2CST9_STEMA|nr:MULTISPECIES: MFS transporter [Stenotrophomonas]MBD3827531.1 MFS transporter [Stenotrophomonas sp.]TGY31461.1 MFS transporter [Stenotrophomonas maltophilia]